MKMFIFAFAFLFSAVAYSGELQSVMVSEPTPAAVAAPAPAPAPVVKTECNNGRCCTGNRCYVREPRFERNVTTSTTCDSCGVKEYNRTVSRTRRFR